MISLIGLQSLNLTPDRAKDLPRGKRRAVASYLLRYGFYEEARNLLRYIIADNPSGMLYRTWLAQAEVACGNADRAVSLTEDLITEFPESRMVILARAEALLAAGDTDAAFDIFKLYAHDPDQSHGYWTRVGAAAQRAGRWDGAAEALKRAHHLFVNRPRDDDEGPQYILFGLWTALAVQAEHEGASENASRDDLEKLREAEREEILAELARPGPANSARSESPRQRAPEPAIESKPDPEVVRALEASALLPEPNPELDSHLHRLFGFKAFRPGQQRVVEDVLAGRSVLAAMPTGAGKSLCYQLPAMLLDGITLVVSPLIALMKDQVDGLPARVQEQATLVNSTLDGDEIDRRLRDIRAGKYKLVYAAPERLRQRPFLHAIRSRGVSLFVVDEAHCVSMWGHDFRPDYLFIGDALRYLGDPTVLAMTATATADMRVEISNYFGRQLNIVSTGTYRPNLFLECHIVRSDEEKMRRLIEICREIGGTGIVYTRSRKKAEELARLLSRERVRATYYHAGMDGEARTRSHEEFMDDRWRVICATVAFGMGIDKPDVRFVAHYSLPSSLEDYYQEAGRAGRDGLPSRCILLCTPSDKANMTRWLRQERMDVDLPKKCYQMIRELTPDSPYAAVPADDFERDLGVEETKVRSAISLLEKAGLVRRHLDVPVTVSVMVTSKGAGEGDSGFQEFLANARFRVGQRMPLETMELARRAAIEPSEIEQKLLEWQAMGWVSLWSSGRVMLLERLPAPRESKRIIGEMLARYARTQDMRVELTFRYAETRRCRHGMIAGHFGEPPPEGCESCDNCSPREHKAEPVSRQAKPIETDLSDAEKKHRIIETVRMVPGKVGFTGLVRILKGSVASYIKHDTCANFGIFANLPKTVIERCVGELIEEGAIYRDDGEYRLIWPSELNR